MGKCLFFDADGTILDIVKGTPEDTKLALQQLRKNGHKTFICTGRSNAFVPEYLMKEIGFDGLIANLGAYIEYNGTRVFEREMPTDLAWKTVEIIKANGFIPVLEGNDYMYYNLDEYTSDIDWFADLITQELGDKLLPIRGNEHNLHFNKISAKRTPGCNPEKLCQELSLWYDYIIHSGSFVGRTIEFVMKGCSKGLAISVMSNVLGYEKRDVIAFGDSNNDLPMFQAAGFKVAMGNGSEDLKSQACDRRLGRRRNPPGAGISEFDLKRILHSLTNFAFSNKNGAYQFPDIPHFFTLYHALLDSTSSSYF